MWVYVCETLLVGAEVQACVWISHIGADNINSVPNAGEIEFAAG